MGKSEYSENFTNSEVSSSNKSKSKKKIKILMN